MNWKKAKEFANNAHKNVNQKYDEHEYIYHLEMVAGYVQRFNYLLKENERELALIGAYNHDVLEDCHLTYNDIKKEFGEDVAEIIYALTNDKGRTREERAGAKYYKGLRTNKIAHFVKICDRLANVEYSKTKGSNMFGKYKKERFKFCEELYTECFKDMFDMLEKFYNE